MKQVNAEGLEKTMTAVIQFLYGGPMNIHELYELCVITDGSLIRAGDMTYKFKDENRVLLLAPDKPEQWSGGYVSFDGSIGHEGDQAIIGDLMIVETVSYSALPFLQVGGPTYVVVENTDDRALFMDDCRRFAETGELPEFLTVPGIILDVGTVLGGIGATAKRCFVLNGIESAVPCSASSILAHESDDLLIKAFVAAVFIVQSSASHSQIIFSRQSTDIRESSLLLFNDETCQRSTVFDLNSGRMFRLSRHAFEVLAAVRDGEGAMKVVAGRLNVSFSELREAREHVLRRLEDS